MFEQLESFETETQIIAIGVGTVGCKILSTALSENDDSVKTVFIHSSEQFLSDLGVNKVDTIPLSKKKENFRINTPYDALTAIKNKQNKLEDLLALSDIVFVVSGLGGATGSGCSPFIVEVAQKSGALCIGMFSLPFEFEGRGKRGAALKAYAELTKETDSLLLIENEKLLNSNELFRAESTSSDLFQNSNTYFSSLINGLSSLVTRPGLINVDCQDLKSLLKRMGPCMVGHGVCYGKNKAKEAVSKAFDSITFMGLNIRSAKGCVVNITLGMDSSIDEFDEIGKAVQEALNDHATIIVGTVIDTTMVDKIEVICTLSGLNNLIMDTNAVDESFFTEIVRTIEFEPHQASSGIAILSYFGEVIKQKHTDIEAKVRIEQTHNSVVLVIETPTGQVEKIEKTLNEYGEVILGKKRSSEFLTNDVDAHKLEFKLEMTSLELKQNEKLLGIYKNQNDEYKERLNTLEVQVSTLHNALAKGLSNSNENLQKLISSHEKIPDSLLNLLKSKEAEIVLNEEVKNHIKSEVIKLHSNDKQAFLSFNDLVKNGVYGVTSNSLYNFLITIIQSLPK